MPIHTPVHVAAAADIDGRDSETLADVRYADLFSVHRTAVLKLASLLAGDRHVAEEVTAEVFAKVLPTWRRGGVEEPLRYRRRAVVNEVSSRFRRRGHERRALARYAARPGAQGAADRLELRDPLRALLQED